MPKRLGKTRLERIARKDTVADINRWWYDRINEGKLLRLIDYVAADGTPYFVPGFDYKGSPPWPSLVSLDALHMDFLLSDHAAPIQRIPFANIWRKVAGVQRGVSKAKHPRNDAGEKLWDKHCVFYDVSHIRPESAREGYGRVIPLR